MTMRDGSDARRDCSRNTDAGTVAAHGLQSESRMTTWILEARKYAARIRNAAKRGYADAYIAHLLGDAPEPHRGALSFMGAQAVRHRLAEIRESARDAQAVEA